MPFVITRSLKLTLVLIAVFVISVAVLLPLSRLSFDMGSVRGLLKAGLAIVGTAIVLGLIDWRLEGDASPIAAVLRWAARRVGRLASVLGIMALLTSSVALLSYLAATTNFPLQDARFANWDRALGFDWLTWLGWVDRQPWLAKLLSGAYHTSFAQVITLLVLLVVLGHDRDLWDFVALFAVTSVAVILISIAVPAAGATAYHAPVPSLLTSHHPLAGRWHLDAFLGVRDGHITAIGLDRLEGIVQFPSFHTVLAIITTYAVRNIAMRSYRVAVWPVAALNALIIVSTLTEGGHYLVDVLAGGAVAGGAIVLVRWLAAGELPGKAATASAVRPSPGAGSVSPAVARPPFEWRPEAGSA